MNQMVPVGAPSPVVLAARDEIEQFVTVVVGREMFGIPILDVSEIFTIERLHRVPLAPEVIAGSLNLRGRVVTVISLSRRLGIAAPGDTPGRYCVTLERNATLYGLLVDGIGDVVEADTTRMESVPGTVSAGWRHLCMGVYRLKGRLLLPLDVERILDFASTGQEIAA